jgi:hypothetical protein
MTNLYFAFSTRRGTARVGSDRFGWMHAVCHCLAQAVP